MQTAAQILAAPVRMSLRQVAADACLSSQGFAPELFEDLDDEALFARRGEHLSVEFGIAPLSTHGHGVRGSAQGGQLGSGWVRVEMGSVHRQETVRIGRSVRPQVDVSVLAQRPEHRGQPPFEVVLLSGRTRYRRLLTEISHQLAVAAWSRSSSPPKQRW